MTDHAHASSAGQEAGFTGVDWAARPAGQLRADLYAGPGPVPAGELGAACASSAIELEACAAELRALLLVLESDVVMAASPLLSEHGRRLADWLETAAAESRELAERALTHTGAVTRARATMPSATELDATEEALDVLSQLGPGIAGLLGGAHHALEQARLDGERAAAAVMRLYEQQTAPLVAAEPEHIPAPRLTLPELPERPEPSQRPSAPVEEELESAPIAPLATPAAAPPAAMAVGAARPRPSYAHAAEKATNQVRPAALVGGAVPPAAGTSGHGLGVPSMTAGIGGAGTTQPAAPVAPIGPAAPVHRGETDPAPSGPVTAVRDTPARAADLYGLSVAVAPPVIGEAQAGEAS